MKFFIDTADLNEIREANEMGVLDGVTTNPSLMRKVGGSDFHAHIAKICDIVDGEDPGGRFSSVRRDRVVEITTPVYEIG